MTARWLAFGIVLVTGCLCLAVLYSEWRWQRWQERVHEVVKPLPSDWEERL